MIFISLCAFKNSYSQHIILPAQIQLINGNVSSITTKKYLSAEFYNMPVDSIPCCISTEKFDNKGNNVEWLNTGNYKSQYQKIVYAYNSSNKQINSFTYQIIDNDTVLVTIDSMIYDDSNKIVHWLVFDKSGTPIAFDKSMEYDSCGNLIKLHQYFLEDGDHLITTKFNHNNQRVATTDSLINISKYFSKSWSFEYNEMNELVKQISKEKLGEKYIFTLEYTDYDEFKNWTKCLSYQNSKLESTEIRTIIYR